MGSWITILFYIQLGHFLQGDTIICSCSVMFMQHHSAQLTEWPVSPICL